MKVKFIPNLLMTKRSIPSLLSGGFNAPQVCDCRDFVLQTEDQGQTSECACYSATSYIEALNRRKYGTVNNLDPHKVYQYAKTIDNYPDIDGTTLDAALTSIIHFDMFNASSSDIVLFHNIYQAKIVLFKYGTCLLGFNISESWMNHYNRLVLRYPLGSSIGGHCVTACGYNKDGIYIQNSWNKSWGKYGFALVPWDIAEKQFMYGAYIKNSLNNLG